MHFKFQAERIFDGYSLLGYDQVLITDHEGVIIDVVNSTDAGDDIRKFSGILSPGFINCHCHLELSHMKGKIPEKTGLVDFVFKVVTERNHDEKEIQSAIEQGELEMLNNGIVAVGDICNNRSTIIQKQKKQLSYYNFIEASGWLPEVSSERFERARELYDEFEKFQPGRSSIVPHAPYSVSQQLWSAIQPWFENKPVSIHNQETNFEDEFFKEGTGDFNRMYALMKIDNSHHVATKKTSLQSYIDKLATAKNILLVHNTFTREEDIAFIKTKSLSVFFCLCPRANLYIENALPDVEMFLEHGCNMTLGTDSLASNHSLDIASEINMLRDHFLNIPVLKMLQWATSNGAAALGLAGFGSFDKQNKPGILNLQLRDEKIMRVERIL
jgi:cytosine/adenosine deaminase-related metal-dependent hydrolase